MAANTPMGQVIRTSEPIGVKPQARKARSERALPGATWAQHHSPTGTHAQAGGDQPPPGARRRRRRVEQLDRQLAPADETAAEDDHAVGFDDDLDVAAVAQRPLHSGVLGERPHRAASPVAPRAPPTPRAASTTSTVPISRSPPASQLQHVGMQRPAEAAAPPTAADHVSSAATSAST